MVTNSNCPLLNLQPFEPFAFGPVGETTSLKSKLLEDGFIRFSGAEIAFSREDHLAWRAFCERNFAAMPADPYCRVGLRKRRHATYVFLPWNDTISAAPTVLNPTNQQQSYAYYQGPAQQPEHGGVVRYFMPVLPDQRLNPALLTLMRFDFSLISWPYGAMPVSVHVSVVSLEPQANEPAVITPNAIHQDGEPYTFVHLVERRGVSGGLNFITRPQHVDKLPAQLNADGILSEFVLEEPMDSFGVDDKAVAHYLSPVMATSERAGPSYRRAVAIDFTPLAPTIP